MLLPGSGEVARRIFVVPRAVADERAKRNRATTKSADARYWRQDAVPALFARFENNFCLKVAL